MEHQVALLQKHDYFLSARHLDRLEPQFLGACQQVESVLRALGQQQQNTDGVNIMKPVAATGETVSTPSTVSVTTAASVPATPSKRPSSPETDSMAARLKALRDKDPFAYMAVTTAEFEQGMTMHGEKSSLL